MKATGVDGGMVCRAIRVLIEKGYIRPAISGGKCLWHWTHNNRVDVPYPPMKLESAADIDDLVKKF